VTEHEHEIDERDQEAEATEHFKRLFYGFLAIITSEFGSRRVISELEFIVEHPEVLTNWERSKEDLRVAVEEIMTPMVDEMRQKAENQD